jgi:hypothetical protein
MRLSLCFLLLGANAIAQSKLNNFREVTGFAAPESVAVSDDYIYVSNVGATGKPTDKDSNGFISRLDKRRAVILEKEFIKGLHGPKGMAIIKNTLYVTDIDRVLGFDLTTKKQVFEVSFANEKTAFANDIAVRDNNTLYVSATDIDKIFVVNIAKKSYAPLDVKTPKGVNGLWYVKAEKALYVNGFGANAANGELGIIKNLDAKQPKYEAAAARKGYMDGLCVPEKDVILYSDWVNFEGKQGRINLYDPKTEMTKIVPLERAFGGPADFYFDTTNSCFYIPCMLENILYIQQIGGILSEVEVETEGN